ncbi:hypothetical protein HanLR1_Chr06g0198581 [Helianthus annuus]|nr:hypothetical protein HanHA89_Chr06g0213411 [Helianthus annuus]KAJ0736676.1 hypothetical protein HanLR1_Chr06g0198581 [Helianthus annuus]
MVLLYSPTFNEVVLVMYLIFAIFFTIEVVERRIKMGIGRQSQMSIRILVHD